MAEIIITKGEIITKARLKRKNTIHTANTSVEIIIPKSEFIDEDISNYELICIEKVFLPYKLTDKSKLEFYNIQFYSKSSSFQEFLQKFLVPIHFFQIEEQIELGSLDPQRMLEIKYNFYSLYSLSMTINSSSNVFVTIIG